MHDSITPARGDLLRVLRLRGDSEALEQVYAEYLAALDRACQSPDADARVLRALAVELIDCEASSLRDPARALEIAELACAASEAAGGADLWMHLDTLAQAQHQTGDTTHAVDTMRRAIAMTPAGADAPTVEEMRTRLQIFEAALSALPVAADGPDGEP